MSGQARSTILVVDTDENVRKLISTALVEANFLVLEARGGMEGVATMLRYDGEIALAVVEIKMPGVNGLDLANQIGIERPTTEILYVSSVTNSVAVESITRAKPDAVLAKPFTQEQLLDRVQHLFPGRALHPSPSDHHTRNRHRVARFAGGLATVDACSGRLMSSGRRAAVICRQLDGSTLMNRDRVKADHVARTFPVAK